MSDHTEDTLPTDALEAEVAELIDEVERKAEAVEARLGDDDDAEIIQILSEVDEAASSADSPTLDDDIQALIAEAERPGSELEPEPDGAAGVVQTGGPATPLADQQDAEVESILAAVDGDAPEPPAEGQDLAEPLVEHLVEEADANATPTAEPPPPSSPQDADETLSNSSLDDELAAEADDAIGSEIAGEIETVDLGGALSATEDVAEAPEPVAPSSSPDPVPEPAPEQPPAPAPEDSTPPAPAGPSRGAAVLAALFALLSRPLDRLSVKQRDTVGWIAINALFLAACVWLYSLLR